MYLNKDR